MPVDIVIFTFTCTIAVWCQRDEINTVYALLLFIYWTVIILMALKRTIKLLQKKNGDLTNLHGNFLYKRFVN